jgi:hypothetical protein
MKESWNVLDFVVVVTSFSAFLPPEMQIQGTSALRTFRALRPLRTVNRIPALRILVVTLINSVPQLSQAGTLGLFIFTLFGIVGLQLWGVHGSFHNRYMHDSPPPVCIIFSIVHVLALSHCRCFGPLPNQVCDSVTGYTPSQCYPEHPLKLEILCEVVCATPNFTCMVRNKHRQRYTASYHDKETLHILVHRLTP